MKKESDYSVRSEYLKEIQLVLKEHKKLYGKTGGEITLQELDKLLGIGEYPLSSFEKGWDNKEDEVWNAM